MKLLVTESLSVTVPPPVPLITFTVGVRLELLVLGPKLALIPEDVLCTVHSRVPFDVLAGIVPAPKANKLPAAS